MKDTDEFDDVTRTRLLASALLRILWLVLLYTVALWFSLRHGEHLPSTTWVSLPLQVAFVVVTLDFLRSTGLPARAFGLTRHALAADIGVGLRVALPLVAGVVGLKWILLPDRCLFEPSTSLWLLPLYLLSVVLQELVLRGGIQNMLGRLLPGRRPGGHALLLASALFAVTHLHLSGAVAVASLPLGLLWGALYARQRRLGGVVACHFVVGAVSFFLVGVE